MNTAEHIVEKLNIPEDLIRYLLMVNMMVMIILMMMMVIIINECFFWRLPSDRVLVLACVMVLVFVMVLDFFMMLDPVWQTECQRHKVRRQAGLEGQELKVCQNV